MRPKYVKDEQYFGIFTYLTAGSALAEYYTTAGKLNESESVSPKLTERRDI